MIKKINPVVFLIMVLAAVSAIGFTACTGASETAKAEAENYTMIVAMRGYSEAVPKTLADFGDGRGALEALCFPNVDVVDVATGEIIGTGEDCLAEVGDGDNGGVLLTGTTFFNLPEGQLVSRGRTTVQPSNEVAPGSPITHITGAIPAPGTDQVISGTGKYGDASGTVRLSGAVDLSSFNGEGTPIGFDCIFEITLRSS
ncbi:MAG: hypothetical protein ACE5Q6_17980 [Dehalococcoidia bacterium]